MKQYMRCTKWRPMRDTTLDSWQKYSAELIQRRSPISEEARELAQEVCGHTDVCKERAEQLAQHCVEKGEQEMLLEVSRRVGETGSYRAWARLLSELILARRGKKARRTR